MAWKPDEYAAYGGYSESEYYGSYSAAPDSSISMYDDRSPGQQQQQPPHMWSYPDPNYPTYYDPNAYPQPGSSNNTTADARGGGSASMPVPGALLANPIVSDMAMQYSQDLIGRGQEELKKNLDKYVSIGELKYYFAVDTTYVAQKLLILLMPFTHTDWTIKYASDEPVQPRFDVNAPDLYIPSMAYVTYVLLVGYVSGINNSFSPDALAATASSALVLLLLELGLIYLSLLLMSINTTLTKWDVLAFSGYKYVAMIVALMSGILLHSKGYYLGLVYSSLSLGFFLLRTLKLRIDPEVNGMQSHKKRKFYLICVYACLQPLLIWWMTCYFVPTSAAQVP